MCVVRQMVEALEGYELAEIQDQMDDVQKLCYRNPKRNPFERKSWQNVGVTPRMLLEWCKQRKIPCTILHGNAAVEKYQTDLPPRQGRGIADIPIVACFWGSHAYLWKGRGALRVAKRGIHPTEGAKVKMTQKICQGESKTPAFSLWRPWQDEIEKGHYYTDDIDAVRLSLLQQGISPRLSMKDRHKIRQLTIGKTIIHTVPTNLDSINFC